MEKRKENMLVVVVGPTAIGKTSLGIKIANLFRTEVISSDSRQFYKEMSIGTAVPTKEELSQVKHHFIQNLSIKQNYTIGDFEKEALELLKKLFEDFNVLVMVGGSGMYEKAVTRGLDYFPDVPYKIRENLNKRFESEGIEVLQKQLKELDPNYYKEVDLNNPRRVIRALEVCLASKKTYSYYKTFSKPKRSFKILKVGLEAPRDELYRRINERVDLMFEQGLFEEAKSLYNYRSYNALQTVGYKEIFKHIEGEYDLEKAKEEVKKNTRRFAKRQITWYKKDKEVKWFNYLDSDKVIEYLQSLS